MVEAEESDFDEEADPVVLSDAPSSAPLPGEPEIEAPTSVVGTSPSNSHGLVVGETEAT